MSNQSEDGIDLEGTVVYKGVHIENGTFTIDTLWYSAYVRSATNEKGIVRSYISACNSVFGGIIKNKIYQILQVEFGGIETE